MPKSKRNNSQLVSYIPREQLKHHMVLPENVEERLLSIEQEYAARERHKNIQSGSQKKSTSLWSSGMWQNYERRKNSLEFRFAFTESQI